MIRSNGQGFLYLKASKSISESSQDWRGGLLALLMRITYVIQEVIVGVKSGVSVAYNDSMLVAMAVKFIQHFSKNSGWSLSEGP